MTTTTSSGERAGTGTATRTMQAIRYERYGGPEVLALAEIGRPEPGPGEVLVQVAAASVNPYDWHFMRGDPALVRLMAGLRRPKPARRTLGADFSGTVAATGPGVTELQAGDEVFGLSTGAFAEFVRARVEHVARKPWMVSHQHAASVPIAGLTALQALRDHGGLTSDGSGAGEEASSRRVLVNGAAGGVGTYAVQIARAFGAHVTGVCSTRNLELVGGIGADEVVDYTREDFTQRGERYDLVIDAVGNRSLGDLRRVVDEGGRYIGVAGSPLRGVWLKVVGRGRMKTMLAQRDRDDLERLAELLDGGEIEAVIDRSYRLEEVPEAIAYLEEGHARGKVVISI